MGYLEARSLPSLLSTPTAPGHRACRLFHLHRLSRSVSPLIREPALGGRDLRPSQTRPPDLARWPELARTPALLPAQPLGGTQRLTAQRPVSFLPPRLGGLGAHPRARQGESPAWAPSPSPSPSSARCPPPASPRPWSAPPARGPQSARGQGPGKCRGSLAGGGGEKR